MTTRRSPISNNNRNQTKLSAELQESDTASDCKGSDWDRDAHQKVTIRPKRKHGDLQLGEIKEILTTIQTQQSIQSTRFDEITKQNNDIKLAIDFMSSKYEEVLEQLQRSKEENTMFKTKIKMLERKIEALERNSKSHCLEIGNVPEQQLETKSTLLSIVKTVAETLDIEIQDTCVSNVYRPKTKTNKNNPIVVEFASTLLKENMIKASKSFNKRGQNKLNTTHLKIEGQQRPVFISESLTAYGRRLHFLAREYTKNHNFASCWTAYGKIYMRERDGERARIINCEEDLLAINK